MRLFDASLLQAAAAVVAVLAVCLEESDKRSRADLSSSIPVHTPVIHLILSDISTSKAQASNGTSWRSNVK